VANGSGGFTRYLATPTAPEADAMAVNNGLDNITEVDNSQVLNLDKNQLDDHVSILHPRLEPMGKTMSFQTNLKTSILQGSLLMSRPQNPQKHTT